MSILGILFANYLAVNEWINSNDGMAVPEVVCSAVVAQLSSLEECIEEEMSKPEPELEMKVKLLSTLFANDRGDLITVKSIINLIKRQLSALIPPDPEKLAV